MDITTQYHKELIKVIRQIEQLNQEDFNQYSVQVIIDFLEKSHQTFINQSIPKIEQNFLELNKLFPENTTLKILFNLFLKFQSQFKHHISIEEKTLFGYAKILYQASISSTIHAVLFIHFGKYSVKDFVNTHKNNECYLTEIIGLLEKSIELKSLAYTVLLNQLHHMNNELKTHGWIEDNVLVNKVLEIEQAVSTFVSSNK